MGLMQQYENMFPRLIGICKEGAFVMCRGVGEPWSESLCKGGQFSPTYGAPGTLNVMTLMPHMWSRFSAQALFACTGVVPTHWNNGWSSVAFHATLLFREILLMSCSISVAVIKKKKFRILISSQCVEYQEIGVGLIEYLYRKPTWIGFEACMPRMCCSCVDRWWTIFQHSVVALKIVTTSARWTLFRHDHNDAVTKLWRVRAYRFDLQSCRIDQRVPLFLSPFHSP